MCKVRTHKPRVIAETQCTWSRVAWFYLLKHHGLLLIFLKMRATLTLVLVLVLLTTRRNFDESAQIISHGEVASFLCHEVLSNEVNFLILSCIRNIGACLVNTLMWVVSSKNAQIPNRFQNSFTGKMLSIALTMLNAKLVFSSWTMEFQFSSDKMLQICQCQN